MMLQEEPRIVKSHDIHIDADYADWIAEVKHRYRSAQVKAAVKVNAEKLLFNWQLGRDLVQKKAEERWGAGVVEQVSLDLKREFPDAEGFSTSNLWYMKKWYLFYTNQKSSLKLQRFVGELQSSVNQVNLRLQQPVGEVVKSSFSDIDEEFPLPFALVPWGQHIEIITRCKSLEESLFYIQQVIEKGLSRTALINCIKANQSEHQGKIINNYTDHLPALQSKLVQEVLLEMGTGFAFLGRQKEILVGGRTRKIDLLFYHIRLRCYIVCELKAKPFEPEFAGKLNYYVNAVDELMKSSDDNPTIGLLVCSDMDRIDVQWSFKGISTPMGVATYNNIRIKDALPSQEQLAERVRLLQKELQETKRLMNKRKEI